VSPGALLQSASHNSQKIAAAAAAGILERFCDQRHTICSNLHTVTTAAAEVASMVVVAMDMMYQTTTRAVLSSCCSSSCSSCSSSAAVAKVNVQQQLWQQQSWSAGSGSRAFVPKSKDEHLATGFLGCGGTQRLLLCFKGEAAAERGRGRVLLVSSNNNGPASVVAELEKPFGLRFYKGSDGGTYIDAIAPGGSADKTKLFTPGDRVIATR
jgi:hypothetical protein